MPIVATLRVAGSVQAITFRRGEAKVLHIFVPSGLDGEGVKPGRRDVGKIEAGGSPVSASRDAESTKDASRGGVEGKGKTRREELDRIERP